MDDSKSLGAAMRRHREFKDAYPDRDDFVELIAELLWKIDYPDGGSIYKTYASLQFHDKELHRKEAKILLASKMAHNLREVPSCGRVECLCGRCK